MSASEETLAQYDMTIGIECHVQLATATKLFSPADNDARDAEPNTKVHPIDFGLPGMLPMLNRHAVDLAIRAGKALNAGIAHISRFDRKHYFYPDLPKGYQISQMYQPIILSGYVDAPLEDGNTVRVRIHHAHMEEDAGKLTHFSGYSLIDLNRAGTPLIEIVSEPDIHSAVEAKAYVTELHRLMTYAEVTRGDLYHGNMRFDVNVSAAKKGASELGTRAEVKNLNSFRSVERAAEYEFHRQVELLESGQRVVQETRGWNDDKGVTTSQRSKEDAQDYRYMPDADIPPIVLSDAEIAEIQAQVPPLPAEYRQKWLPLNLDASVVNTLLNTKSYANLVSEIQDTSNEFAKTVAHWFTSSIAKLSDTDVPSTTGLMDESLSVDAEDLITLARMKADNQVSSNGAETLFFEIIKSAHDGQRLNVQEFAQERGLLQVSDESAIAAIVDEVLADPASATSIADIKAGKEKAIGFLVGQVMKRSQGQANPGLAQKLIRERI